MNRKLRSILPLLLVLNISMALAQRPPLRVISYNILEGMKLDTTTGKTNFVDWVKKMDPDILALQEVTHFTQATLEKLAEQYGHRYAVLLIEGEKFPVAITSKYPILNVQKVSDNMDRGFITATINGFNILCVHLTPFDYRKRAQEIDLMLAHIRLQPSRQNWIVMGDFNTLSPIDSVHYSDGRMVASYQAYEKKYAPIQKLADGRIDYSVIEKVHQAGFTDALKKVHPEFVKTVHPKRFEPKNGAADVAHRIDFIFISKDLVKKIGTASVLVDEFTDNYSDHYPVLFELK